MWVLLPLLGFITLGRAELACYYPNGDLANDKPCNTSAPASTCCGASYACLSNNICVSTSLTPNTPGSTLYVRGSCTDQSWKSPDCPQFCIDPQYDDTAGGEGIAKCPNTELDEYYCIDGSASNCTTHQNVLLFQGQPSYVYNPAATSTSTSFSTSATTSSATTSAGMSPSSSTSSHTSSLVSTPALSSSSPTSSPGFTSSPSTGNSAHNAVAIGAGVGVGVGVFLLALAALFVFLRKWRKRRAAVTTRKDPDAHRQSLPLDYRHPSPGIPVSKQGEMLSEHQLSQHELESHFGAQHELEARPSMTELPAQRY